MKIAILSTFPEMFEPLKQSIIHRATENGILSFDMINIRDFSNSKHKNTDDYPYGGGAGMLMTVQPIDDAFLHTESLGYTGKRIYMSPKGKTLTQSMAAELAMEKDLRILCGHYEGVDQRALDMHIDMEVSIGDYVLTGGELAAMVLIDSVSRLIPGVLGSDESSVDESFSSGLLEYPQYTRPAEYKGLKVPDVLLGGNHALIAKWRHREALINTYKFRPDMLNNISAEDRLILKHWEEENA